MDWKPDVPKLICTIYRETEAVCHGRYRSIGTVTIRICRPSSLDANTRE